MRDAEWGDLTEEEARLYCADLAIADDMPWRPACMICGVVLRVLPDGNRPVVCSLTCALELARREELRDPAPDELDDGYATD